MCHLCEKSPPSYRFNLTRNNLAEPVGWLGGSAGGKRGNVHDGGLHKMDPIYPTPSAGGSPEHSSLEHPGGLLSASSIAMGCRKPSHCPAVVAAMSPAEEGEIITSSSVSDIISFLALVWTADISR